MTTMTTLEGLQAIARDFGAERRSRQLIEQLGEWLPPEGPVLDLGSGTGHLADHLERELGLEVVTADVSDMHVTGRPPVLIQDGVLVDFMWDHVRSRKDGRAPSGNGRRQSYMHLPMVRMTNTVLQEQCKELRLRKLRPWFFEHVEEPAVLRAFERHYWYYMLHKRRGPAAVYPFLRLVRAYGWDSWKEPYGVVEQGVLNVMGRSRPVMRALSFKRRLLARYGAGNADVV